MYTHTHTYNVYIYIIYTYSASFARSTWLKAVSRYLQGRKDGRKEADGWKKKYQDKTKECRKEDEGRRNVRVDPRDIILADRAGETEKLCEGRKEGMKVKVRGRKEDGKVQEGRRRCRKEGRRRKKGTGSRKEGRTNGRKEDADGGRQAGRQEGRKEGR
jgi:hypothetical protein